MKLRVLRSFSYSLDGIASRRAEVDAIVSDVPEAYIAGLMAERFVERWWPEAEPEAKAIPAAPENKAIVRAPENKRRR